MTGSRDDLETDTQVTNFELLQLIRQFDRRSTRKRWFEIGLFFCPGVASPYTLKVVGY